MHVLSCQLLVSAEPPTAAAVAMVGLKKKRNAAVLTVVQEASSCDRIIVHFVLANTSYFLVFLSSIFFVF